MQYTPNTQHNNFFHAPNGFVKKDITINSTQPKKTMFIWNRLNPISCPTNMAKIKKAGSSKNPSKIRLLIAATVASSKDQQGATRYLVAWEFRTARIRKRRGAFSRSLDMTPPPSQRLKAACLRHMQDR